MKARLHSRMLLGLCEEGFLATVTMTARLLRHAKMPQGAGFIRDLKIEVFRHFPRTANVKKSRDQSLAVRFAV